MRMRSGGPLFVAIVCLAILLGAKAMELLSHPLSEFDYLTGTYNCTSTEGPYIETFSRPLGG